MPLCEHTVMRCGSQVDRCRQGEPGWLSLQFRVAGLSWPLELLGRMDWHTVGFWSLGWEGDGMARADRLAEALMRGAKGAFIYCDAAGSRSSCAVMHGVQMAARVFQKEADRERQGR